MNAPQTGTSLATKKDTSVAVFSNFLDKFKPQLKLALPAHLNADRMARLALTAFSGSEQLQQCTPKSIAASLMTAGQLGLEPGVNGAGYLIPYKTTCTFVPGWKGLVDLVSRAGRATVWTGVVNPGDEFDYQLGDAPFCRHKPGDEIGGKWTHVYAIGRVRDAQMPVIEVWTRSKVERHLTTYNKVGNRHYAKESENNFAQYGRKVALLQVLKYMPQSVEVATATKIADMADTGRGVVLDGDFVRFVDSDQDHQEQPAKQELPPYPADTFAANMPAWTKLVKDDKKTGEALLTMFSTKNTFTPEQQAALKALDAPPQAADGAAAAWVDDMNAAEGAAK